MAKANRNVFPPKSRSNISPLVTPAPMPSKGNTRLIYEYLAQHGPMPQQALERGCTQHPGIVVRKRDKQTTVKQAIYNMTYNGIVNTTQRGPGNLIFSIAPEVTYNARQLQLETAAALSEAKKEETARNAVITADLSRFDEVAAQSARSEIIAIAASLTSVVLLVALVYVAYIS